MNQEAIAVVGLGLLGRGIAACLLGHGLRVIGLDLDSVRLAEAETFIDRHLEEMTRYQMISEARWRAWHSHWVRASDFAQLGGSTFVIESVVEDAQAKQQVYDELEGILEQNVPIATNTSAIPITQLQQQRVHPERFLGMHWAEPAYATRFMELIRGEQTAEAAILQAVELARRLEKEPCIVQKDSPGFIVNRIGYAMYREAITLLDEGVADIETIDTACRNAFGLWASVCGPFRWIDLTGGPALYAKAMRGVLKALDKDSPLPGPLGTLEVQGATGTKEGHGFYDYTPDEARRWEELYHEQAWRVREIVNHYFPLTKRDEKGTDE